MKPSDYIKLGSEYEHQVAFFMWIALNRQTYPKASKAFAIKNEEKSGSIIVGTRQKASGVKSGTHDILLPVPRGVGPQHDRITYNGLFIEMKKLDGTPSNDQLEFGLSVQEEGYAWEVCYGWEHGVRVLKNYLEGTFFQKDVERQKLKYNK